MADKDALPVVYGQGNGAFHKSRFYDAFVCDKASVFSTTDRQDHAQKRRLVSQAFSYKSLQQCIPFIHDILRTFVEKLDKFCESDEDVDALVWFNYLAFDVLSDLAFGEPIRMVANVSNNPCIETHKSYLDLGLGHCLGRKLRWNDYNGTRDSTC